LECAIPRRVLDSVTAQARAEAPRECCGLLVGSGVSIVDAVPGRNIAASATTRYLLDPQDHVTTLRHARQRGADVVGFYHSHPTAPAVPSETDRAEASYPGFLYLIVSLTMQPPDVRLYRLVDGNFQQIRFVTVD
jgi:proteasome lid subunit RPN8/RPN11